MPTETEKSLGPFVKVVIRSPIDVVWKEMTDFDSYGKWNSFIIKVEKVKESSTATNTCWDVGDLMALTVKWSDGKQANSVELITILDAPPTRENESTILRTANLTYKFTGWLSFFNLVRAERNQLLRELDKDTTEYTTQIAFSGLFSGHVPVDSVAEGFQRQAQDLKKRCESEGQ